MIKRNIVISGKNHGKLTSRISGKFRGLGGIVTFQGNVPFDKFVIKNDNSIVNIVSLSFGVILLNHTYA